VSNQDPAADQRRDAGRKLPKAVVMNMFYTGLGIARSLGEQGIPVIGLTARRGIYGNFTRYAKTVFCPDSRHEPEALLAFLIGLGRELDVRGVLFPTRDDDLVFLDRFRVELARYFSVAAPDSSVLGACLNKWETYLWARRAGVATPQCWMIERPEDLKGVLREVTWPCVLKPLSAHHWRQGDNWQIVGARKAIEIVSEAELLREYDLIAHADKRALLQEMIPGGDDSLVITACYLDRQSRWVAGFGAQKLVQIPEGFGTGCIVQSVNRPELFEPTARLLETMGFTGVAEVEYKWHARDGTYKLIEINPRPWDQHRLGKACSVDLIYLAYCEHAGLPIPIVGKPAPGHKWIAEDTFFTAALRMAWHRDPKLRSLFRQARGKRLYAIWSARDPLPLIAYLLARFIPELVVAGVRAAWAALSKRLPGKMSPPKKGFVYENDLEKRESAS
jgi:D-aspartate ligase